MVEESESLAQLDKKRPSNQSLVVQPQNTQLQLQSSNFINLLMDIQYDEANQRNNNRSSSLDGHRISMKSRKSNQSCFSIGGTHYLDMPVGQMQKISLQSNISNKAKDKFNHHDLFQHLAHQDPFQFQMRDQGSFKPKYRNTEGEVKKVQEQKMSIELQPVRRQVAEVSCKCPKSKCLLMYCECFSKDLLCNPKCSCYQCRNNPDFEDKRQKARKAVLQKDPNAFTNKLELIGQQSQLALKKGCNCKKTLCSKKYCECFFTGVKCTYLCNCQNCMNGGTNSFKS